MVWKMEERACAAGRSVRSWCARICSGVSLLLAPAVCAADEYVVLDYVEATGGQWVDTGIVGRYDTKAEIKAEWRTNLGDMSVLACRGNDGTNENNTRINFMNGCRADYEDLNIGYGYGYFGRDVNYETWDKKWLPRLWEVERLYTVETEFRKEGAGTVCLMTVDGARVVEKTVEMVVSAECNLFVFGNNTAGTGCDLRAVARCYGLKIWQKPLEGGEYVLVRDFVPVSRNGRAGFCDSVSGGFFFSASAVDLVAGPPVNTPDRFVDYVESAENATYVDLGVVGRAGVRMESRMAWVEVPYDASYVAARQGNTRFYVYHHYQNDTLGYGNYYQSGVVAQEGVVYDVRTVLRAGEQSLTVNGDPRVARTDAAALDTGLNLYLFACNKDGVANYPSRARCYSLKLWEGDKLVRDFRPCLKRGKGALYDEVSKTIFYAGAGTLTAGRVPTPGEPDYFVDYVEARSDSYIDTGVRARNDTRAAGEFKLTVDRSGEREGKCYLSSANGLDHGERTILGACGNDGKKRCYLVHVADGCLWTGYNEWRCYPGTTYAVDENGETVTYRRYLGDARHTFDVTLENGRQAVTLDGQELCVSNVVDTVDAGGNLYVFACNRSGRPTYPANARVYALKIWQRPAAGGEYALVRDLRPCVKDGEPGLYDAVENEVLRFANAVPVKRIGNPVYPEDPRPVKVLEYVDSDGSQWVDTGVTGRTGTVAEFKMAWLYRVGDPDDGFLGSRKDSGETRFYMWHDAHNDQAFGYGVFRYFNLADPTQPNWRGNPGHAAVVSGTPCHVKASFLADGQTVEVDGAKALDIAWESLDTGYPMYLFAENNFGTATNKCAARLYEMKIWQDGELVRHFRPVLLAGNMPALYDTVGRKVYRPQGEPFADWGPIVGDYRSTTVIFVR